MDLQTASGSSSSQSMDLIGGPFAVLESDPGKRDVLDSVLLDIPDHTQDFSLSLPASWVRKELRS